VIIGGEFFSGSEKFPASPEMIELSRKYVGVGLVPLD
jgi:hypothetical protein